MTFLAFLLCATGGGMFAVCLKLVADDMMQLQQDVFHISRPWMEGAAIGLTAAGALIMALSALVFALSFAFWPKAEVSAEGSAALMASKHNLTNNRRKTLVKCYIYSSTCIQKHTIVRLMY